MSRSYKRNPVVKDSNRGMKNCANRKVRRCTTDLKDGGSYRKVFCSYDISDYSFRNTWEEYRDTYFKLFPDLTEDELRVKWKKTYYSK